MRPAIFMRRPRFHANSIELLSLLPDQYGIAMEAQSVRLLFGGKEISIEGSYEDALMETWSSLQESSKEDIPLVVIGRLHDLLRSRAENFYALAIERKEQGQWTYLYPDATVGHSSIENDPVPQYEDVLMIPTLVTPVDAIQDIIQFLTRKTLGRSY